MRTKIKGYFVLGIVCALVGCNTAAHEDEAVSSDALQEQPLACKVGAAYANASAEALVPSDSPIPGDDVQVNALDVDGVGRVYAKGADTNEMMILDDKGRELATLTFANDTVTVTKGGEAVDCSAKPRPSPKRQESARPKEDKDDPMYGRPCNSGGGRGFLCGHGLTCVAYGCGP